MKIIESQNAVLTNVEVYQFLTAQAKEYQEQKRRGPGNLETLRREVSETRGFLFLSFFLFSAHRIAYAEIAWIDLIKILRHR